MRHTAESLIYTLHDRDSLLMESYRCLVLAVTPNPLRSPAIASEPVVQCDRCEISFGCEQLAMMYEASWRVGDQIYYVSYISPTLMYGFHLTCWRELVGLGVGHFAGREGFVQSLASLSESDNINHQ